MQINVAQQLKEPIGVARDYEVCSSVDFGSGECSVEGKVRLTRTNRGILAEGALRTNAKITCSRCLSLFDHPLALNIVEEYFPTADVWSGSPLPVPDEPGCFSIDEHHTLDLTEAVSQYALLDIPMKPLCREACAGLCSGCGQDLNQGQCGCPSQGVGLHQPDFEDRLASRLPSGGVSGGRP